MLEPMMRGLGRDSMDLGRKWPTTTGDGEMFVLPVFGLSHKGGLHEPSLPEAVWPVRELRRGVVFP